jgi:hypothetical protein
MLKNITNAIGALLEGVETLTEKSVAIASDSLDIVGEEVSIQLESTVNSRKGKLDLAQAESDYDLQKAKMKLESKLSALQKLAEQHKK